MRDENHVDKNPCPPVSDFTSVVGLLIVFASCLALSVSLSHSNPSYSPSPLIAHVPLISIIIIMIILIPLYI